MTWKKCGHPRTPENTCNVRAAKPGGACRICQRAHKARYQLTEKGRAVQRAADARFRTRPLRQLKQMQYELRQRLKAKTERLARLEQQLTRETIA